MLHPVGDALVVALAARSWRVRCWIASRSRLCLKTNSSEPGKRASRGASGCSRARPDRRASRRPRRRRSSASSFHRVGRLAAHAQRAGRRRRSRRRRPSPRPAPAASLSSASSAARRAFTASSMVSGSATVGELVEVDAPARARRRARSPPRARPCRGRCAPSARGAAGCRRRRRRRPSTSCLGRAALARREERAHHRRPRPSSLSGPSSRTRWRRLAGARPVLVPGEELGAGGAEDEDRARAGTRGGSGAARASRRGPRAGPRRPGRSGEIAASASRKALKTARRMSAACCGSSPTARVSGLSSPGRPRNWPRK